MCAARVFGGPTQNTETLSWRVLAFERLTGVERVLADAQLRVEVELEAGRVVGWSGKTAADGLADVALNVGQLEPEEKLTLKVTWESVDGPRTLLHAPIHLTPEIWSRYQRRRGGSTSQENGDFRITVTPSHGVLAVPFDDELELLVQKGTSAISGVKLVVTGEGLIFPRGQTFITNSQGRTSVAVRPTFHQADLSVEATQAPGLSAHFHASLPVVPGAIQAITKTKGTTELVELRSPVPRERAYFSVVNENLRLFGGSVPLKVLPDGTAVGRIELPVLHAAPHWLVASEDFDLRSYATVGWPLWPTTNDRTTRDIPDLPLADGLAVALALEKKRNQHARLVAVLVALLGLSASTVLLIHVYRQSRSSALDRGLESLGEVPSEDHAQAFRKPAWWAAVGVILAALGFALLAAFAWVER